MSTTSVSETAADVKWISTLSTAWTWGFQDGASGHGNVYDGLDYWTLGSRQFAEYEAGHKEGKTSCSGRQLLGGRCCPHCGSTATWKDKGGFWNCSSCDGVFKDALLG